MSKLVDPYNVGLSQASVCADNSLTVEGVTRILNIECPTEVDSPWTLSEDKAFRTGQPNPCPCNRDPENRKHYLFVCKKIDDFLLALIKAGEKRR